MGGETPSEKVKSKPYMSVVYLLLTISGFAILLMLFSAVNTKPEEGNVAASPSDQSVQTGENDAPQQQSQEESPTAETNEPPAPIHLWVLHQGHEYGYQPDLSEDDAKAGIATKPLIMVRYLGEKGGEYIVREGSPSRDHLLMSCTAPCDFIKVDYYFGKERISQETIPAGTSMAAIIMTDAMTGQMKP